jgi:hypothetical protein
LAFLKTDPMTYDAIYIALWKFANYKIGGILLCRLLAPLFLVILLWLSRVIQNVLVKFFSVLVAMLLYFLPNIINIFSY